MRSLTLAGCLALTPILLLRLTHPPDPLHRFPNVVLWAWESSHDLRFVKPGSAGIAFLARTIWLDGEHVWSRPRLQPLRFSPGADLMAVVRFESAGHGLPPSADAVREVQRVATDREVRALQIDFDARLSERVWYASFLRDLRRGMPASMPLSITALESWCEEDSWIRGLPVADATPMLFRLGPGERREVSLFSASICRDSVGVSMDELPVRVPRSRRIYFFYPGAWTQQAYNAAVAQAARWRK
jgi:hypothetical protein